MNCVMNNEPRATIYANRRNAPKSNGPHSQKVLEIRSITLFLCAFVPLCLCSFVPLFLRACPLSFTLVVSALQIRPFMQNEPNFRKSQMNVRAYKTKIYGNWTLGERGKNEPNLSCRSLWRSRNEPNLSCRSLWRSRFKAN